MINSEKELPFKTPNAKRGIYSPKPEGNLLSGEDINKVARSMYGRYKYVYGLTPCWGDNKKVDENCRDQVKSVLDSLEMNGFIVIKAPVTIT